MQYALVSGERREAEHGLKGDCPHCAGPVLAKAGNIRIKHWAHRGKLICDRWWENETEWHRAWKGHFPVEWREVRHQDKNTGEWHIADVKTTHEWVLEFQHSHLKAEERQARDAFYPKLIWVVDGKRRLRDRSQFFDALKRGEWIRDKPPIKKMLSTKCALLRDWVNSSAPVFFDFGEGNTPEESAFWCLLPKSPIGEAYVIGFRHTGFITYHGGGVTPMNLDFSEYLNEPSRIVLEHIALRRNQAQDPLALLRQFPSPFWAQGSRHGRRFKF